MKKYIVILLVLFLIAFSFYRYTYKNHRDIKTEAADFVLTSKDLRNQFLRGTASEVEKQYLNKTIEIKGIVTEINNSNLTLDEIVFCQFLNELSSSINKHNQVKIKGRFIGYDDLLEQIKLDQCLVIK